MLPYAPRFLPLVEMTKGAGLLISGLQRQNSIMSPRPTYYVYLITNWNHRVLYVGVTNHLYRRLYEHTNKLVAGFTNRYNLKKLVYVEETSDVNAALEREKQIKKWRREKKNWLVDEMNPEWRDLSEDWS